ncbi:MAG TPA: NUDIX domain-containing protein [Vicinamibacteria bacterium]|nr:NUDIX domain-containing protein [Vicinamibacteria bacterium]
MKSREELLNVYDPAGAVLDAWPRSEAKASGRAVGAVNLLLVTGRGQVLLQRRPVDKENGGLWDKSVGGHVSAGEDFDTAVVREAGEELFDDPVSPRVRLLASEAAFTVALGDADLSQQVVLRRVAWAANLRDVRLAPGGGSLNVLYHVAIYAGRTEVSLGDFRPQASEIAELRYVDASQVDRWLLEGRLAPNMAYLWLTQAHALLAVASGNHGHA